MCVCVRGKCDPTSRDERVAVQGFVLRQCAYTRLCNEKVYNDTFSLRGGHLLSNYNVNLLIEAHQTTGRI